MRKLLALCILGGFLAVGCNNPTSPAKPATAPKSSTGTGTGSKMDTATPNTGTGSKMDTATPKADEGKPHADKGDKKDDKKNP